MRRISLFLLLCFAAIYAVAQRVSGTFSDQPLTEVLEVLAAQQDKHTVSYVHNQLEGITVTANIKGKQLLQAIEEVCREYPLNVKQKGRVIFVQSKLPFGVMSRGGKLLLDEDADIDEDSLAMRLIALREVTIEADRVVHKGDHDVLFLSKESRTFGTNALDAVSSLILFRTSINDTKLLSWDGQQVFVLINGVPSTAMDLRGYKGDEIKSVEYYATAPAQYMGFTSGPLINVVVKKRHESMHSAYLNTSNALNTRFGTNQLDLTYADSLNQVKLGYYIDYRGIREISIQPTIMCDPDHHSQYRGRGFYSGAYQNMYASYQRYQGKHLFNAKLYSIIDAGLEKESRRSVLLYDTIDNQGNNMYQLKSQYNTSTLDVYYRYLFKQGRMLAVNVVNAMGVSYSRSNYEMNTLGGVSGMGNKYNYHNEIDNESYSLIANAMYVSPLWGGQFNAAMRYEYNYLYQESMNVESAPYSHSEFAYAGGSWHWGYGTFAPALGVSLLQQTSSESVHTSVLPYFRLYTDWSGRGTWRGTSAQLTLTTDQRNPSLADLTETQNYIDPWIVSMGNPGLQQYWVSTAKFAFSYLAPDGKDMVSLMVRPSYAHNKIAMTVVRKGNTIYFQPQNIGGELGCSVSLHGSWSLLPWLTLSPYGEYYTTHYHTPSRDMRLNYIRFGGILTATRGNTSVQLAINSPTVEYDGDFITRASRQYVALFQHKWRNWAFGAAYNYSGDNEYTVVELPDFSYYKKKDWAPLHHMVRVTATYSFSSGNARKHDKKMIHEASDNSGLRKFDKPKKAR